MAGLLRKDFRYLHEALEVSAATSANFGHQVRPEAVANWGNCLEDRSTLLSLLVSPRPHLRAFNNQWRAVKLERGQAIWRKIECQLILNSSKPLPTKLLIDRLNFLRLFFNPRHQQPLTFIIIQSARKHVMKRNVWLLAY